MSLEEAFERSINANFEKN